MSLNNSLIARYFSFFYFHSYGYVKKKELCPDNQAAIFVNQPNSLITSKC